MPGSLFLPNDTYSEISDLSTRSLDSKVGTKKVSFNNAVRVKQYPWKPEPTHEHITLPSSRFWFKVYKKQDVLEDEDVQEDIFTKGNSREYENGETKHDVLSPIAEIEDTELDESHLYTGILKNSGKGNCPYNDPFKHKVWSNYSPVCNTSNTFSHDNDPPVDYIQDYNSKPDKIFRGTKFAWDSESVNGNKNSRYNSRSYDVIEEENDNDFSRFGNVKLPRTNLSAGSPLRRSVRNTEMEQTKPRERRSRSHDDHYRNNESSFRVLQRADKSVSTEDLDFNCNTNDTLNTFMKNNRDMATQCYGTLNGTRKTMKASSNGVSNGGTISSKSVFERLSRFKPSAPKQNHAENHKANIYNRNGSNQFSTKTYESSTSPQKSNNQVYNKNYSNLNKLGRNHEAQDNSKNINIDKINGNDLGKLYDRGKSHLSRVDQYRSSTRDFRKITHEKPIDSIRDTSSIGYLRGRQISLSDVNSVPNRRSYGSESNFGRKTNLDRDGETQSYSSYQGIDDKHSIHSDSTKKRTPFGGLYESKQKTFNSSKKQSTKNMNGQDVIDWSLSGFQLAARRDNGVVSDSECTVHRRPPLLMYIPGVSHQHRPAEEDDRLSALSGLSRSDMSDGLSSFKGFSTNDIYSFPKDEKTKWAKWKKG